MSKRKNCYFGFHFDFHATKDTTGLGADFRLSDYEDVILKTRPTCIQVDTKGHPGYASYMTKYSNAAPDMQKDMLRELRDLTRRYGIPIYSHYSGVWDALQTERHPEYKSKFRDGIEYKGETSVFSSYVDDLMIPQLIELALDYGIDGVWIDGECWATQVDYGEAAQNAFYKKFGRKPDLENNHKGYEEFCRQGFFDYVKRYVDAVHAVAPDFEICSNWLYTTFCPGMRKTGVDYISGDYDPENSLNVARFEGRALLRHDVEWDLLCWAFNVQNGYQVTKSAVQLKQELGAVYNLGGGVQIYYTALRGNIRSYELPTMTEVADFAHRIGPVLHNGRVVEDIAVVYSIKGFYTDKFRLFSKWDDDYAKDAMGVTLALADTGRCVEVAFSDYLSDSDNIYNYRMLVIPGWKRIEDDLRDKILEYVSRGGKLIVTGSEQAEYWADSIGYETKRGDSGWYIDVDNNYLGVGTDKVIVNGGEVIHYFYEDVLGNEKKSPAAVLYKYGEGSIVVIPFNFGVHYQDNVTERSLVFLEDCMEALNYRPFIRAEGRYKVDCVGMKGDGEVRINLLNLLGDHSNTKVRQFSYIPPLHGVKVYVDTDTLARLYGISDVTVKDTDGAVYEVGKEDGYYTFCVDVDIQKTLFIKQK